MKLRAKISNPLKDKTNKSINTQNKNKKESSSKYLTLRHI